MLIKPKFWQIKNHPFSVILSPLSILYNLIHKFLEFISNEIDIQIFTICIGNLSMGGSGKTPVVLALRKLLSKKYKKIYVLSRGYRGSNKKAKLVNKNDSIDLVGDEALLHRKYGDICIAKNRVEGAKLCRENKADLLILDDGLQTKHIKKNISFIVYDTLEQFGNKKVFPAGPLREDINYGFSKADAFIIIKNSDNNLDINFPKEKPIFIAKKKIKVPKLKTKNVMAFCGLGSPENFYNILEDYGLKILLKRTFEDHHFYKDNEILGMIEESKKKKLEIITTEKDYIKINKKFQRDINVAELNIIFESEKGIKEFITKTY